MPENLLSMTVTKEVGVVMRVSKVPLLRSPAILRIVNNGTTNKTGIQKTLKNCTVGRVSDGVFTMPRRIAQ